MTFADRLASWLDENSDARWPRRDEIVVWAKGFEDEAAASSATTRSGELVAIAGLRGVPAATILPVVGRFLRAAVLARAPAKEPRLVQAIHAAETVTGASDPASRARSLDLAQALLAEAEKSEKQRRRLEEERKKREPTDKDTKAELARTAQAAVCRACGFAALASAEVRRGSASIVECAYALEDAARAVGALDAASLKDVEASSLRADEAHTALLRAELDKTGA